MLLLAEINVNVLVAELGHLELLQGQDDRHRNQQHHRRNRNQVQRADIVAEKRRHGRPDHRTEAGTGCDDGKEPRRLLAREQVRHEAPEHRDVKQAEDAEPHVKRLVDELGVRQRRRCGEECDERQREEYIDAGHDPAESDQGDQPAIQRHRNDAEEEGQGPEPVDLFLRPLRRYGIAWCAQDEVGGHQRKHEEERQDRRTNFVGFDFGGGPENPGKRTASGRIIVIHIVCRPGRLSEFACVRTLECHTCDQKVVRGRTDWRSAAAETRRAGL